MVAHLASLGVGGAGASGPTTLLLDHFTDANGTALAAHAMDAGPGWTVQAGSCSIQSNQAAPGTVSLFAVADAGNADVTASVDVTPGTGDDAGLWLRGSDSQNGWLLDAQDYGSTALKLYEVVSNGYTVRASSAVTINPGATYTLQAVLSGAAITGTLNAGNPINYSSASSNQTVTKFGLKCDVAATRFDNFQVTRP